MIAQTIVHMAGNDKHSRSTRTVRAAAIRRQPMNITDPFMEGLRAMRRHANIRRARAHLAEMPDYILNDLGIDRSEIASVTSHGGDATRRRRP
jgi:uncharacterized protein YjiS (DUF1127 family)